MISIHGRETPQICHPFPLYFLEMWEVLFFWAWVINLVKENYFETGQVIRRIFMILGPVFAEAAVLALCLNHVTFVLTKAPLKIDRRSAVLGPVQCALQEIHDIGRAAVQVLPYLDRPVVVVGGDGLLLCCHKVPVDLAGLVTTRSTAPTWRDSTTTGARWWWWGGWWGPDRIVV